MKVSIWKVIFTIFIVAVVIVAGILIYKAGYYQGAASRSPLPPGHNFPVIPFHRENSRLIPFLGRLQIQRFFPGLLVGTLCLGILVIMGLVLGFGVARRQLFWNKNGLFDPVNLWEPPPQPGKTRTSDDATEKSSENQ
jgi:hypothetical protein